MGYCASKGDRIAVRWPDDVEGLQIFQPNWGTKGCLQSIDPNLQVLLVEKKRTANDAYSNPIKDMDDYFPSKNKELTGVELVKTLPQLSLEQIKECVIELGGRGK